MLGPGESAEQTLTSPAYDELARLLEALRAHDAKAVEALAASALDPEVPSQRTTTDITGAPSAQDTVPEERSPEDPTADNGEPLEPALLHFAGPPRRDGLLARFINLRVLQPEKYAWRRGLEAALAYRAAHGDLRVPYDYRSPAAADGPAGFPLGTWIAEQRRARRAGRLSSDRITELDSAGMVWSQFDAVFEDGPAACRSWAAVHGHLLPRVDAVTAEGGFPLGRRLMNLRNAARAADRAASSPVSLPPRVRRRSAPSTRGSSTRACRSLLKEGNLQQQTWAIVRRVVISQVLLDAQARLTTSDNPVYGALAKLPPKQFDVFVPREWMNNSAADVAWYMGVTTSTVDYHLRKARERLDQALGRPSRTKKTGRTTRRTRNQGEWHMTTIDQLLADAAPPVHKHHFDVAAGLRRLAREAGYLLPGLKDAAAARRRTAAEGRHPLVAHQPQGRRPRRSARHRTGRERPDPHPAPLDVHGAQVFACLLHLTGHPESAAGADVRGAAYCLHLHHLSRGEEREAAHWLLEAKRERDQHTAEGAREGIEALDDRFFKTFEQYIRHHDGATAAPTADLDAEVERLAGEDGGLVGHPDQQLADRLHVFASRR